MLEDKIMFITDSPLGISMNGRYKNSFSVNGFILQTPKFIKSSKGESCSFIIHQLNKTLEGQYAYKSFSLIAYIPEVVERLKKVNHVCFVNCLCKIDWRPMVKGYFIHVWDFEISCELDTELEPPYKREK